MRHTHYAIDGTITVTEGPDQPADIIAAAWGECQRRLVTGVVTVATSAGTHTYGTDEGTQANIQKALIGVALGITPDPRPWTPKRAVAAVSLTHDDLKLVGGAIGAAVDAHMQTYLAVKGLVLAGAITMVEQVGEQVWP